MAPRGQPACPRLLHLGDDPEFNGHDSGHDYQRHNDLETSHVIPLKVSLVYQFRNAAGSVPATLQTRTLDHDLARARFPSARHARIRALR